MTLLPPRLTISDYELQSFTLAVKTRYGLDFTNYEPKSLKRGLVRLIAKYQLESMIGLWSAMLYNKELIIQYVDELLINLTEFFRNASLWHFLKKELLPTMISEPVIKVWHAGCSTGEEAYSMAIVLKQLGLLYRARLLATDLSSKALAKAKKGVYNNLLWPACQRSFLRYDSTGKMERYFSKEEEEFYIVPLLNNKVRFKRHDLVQEFIGEQFKLIFCRNVMIYFDQGLKQKVLEKLYEALEDDGYLIIGFYDMLSGTARDMFKLHCPTNRIYTKNLAYKPT
ncbi:MAG: CheR family methyltransferase [Aureispira sp.]